MTEDILLNELGDSADNEAADLVSLNNNPSSYEYAVLEKGSCAAKSYYDSLKHVFGSRFLALLFLVQFCIKGVVYQVVRRGLFPLLKESDVEATLVQLNFISMWL